MSKEKFKPHKMYKNGKSVMANTYEEHLALGKKDYGHSPLAKTCNCWKGYKRVKGTKPCAPGSCKKASSVKITEEAYARRNKKMRSKYKSQTGKTLGSKQTEGKGSRRVSFACRFAGMKGSMKDSKGRPTPYAMALKKWGFGSREAAASFCRANKGKSPAKKRGLWDNIHAKRRRGETMRSKGDPGAPTEKAIRDSQ